MLPCCGVYTQGELYLLSLTDNDFNGKNLVGVNHTVPKIRTILGNKSVSL
jgi:hypothetical protein